MRLCLTSHATADRFTAEMDMSVQVESEDQDDVVVNTPSKRRTRAMRILYDDDESVAEEEDDEIDEGEEEAELVRPSSQQGFRLFISIRTVRTR